MICKYVCIGFIDFMLKSHLLYCFTNLFLSNNFKKKNEVISNSFLKWNKYIDIDIKMVETTDNMEMNP